MVLTRFLPQKGPFFQYFREAVALAEETAAALLDVLENYTEVEQKVRHLRALEHQADDVAHQVFNALNTTFVTPLDRGDIRDLASTLDDFIDDMEEAGKRLWLYHVERPTPIAIRLGRIIIEQAHVLAVAIPLLEYTREHPALLRHIVEVNRLEDEADDVFNQALATLYEQATDIPSFVVALQWGELYQLLEDATDRAEDVANTLEGIVLKHA